MSSPRAARIEELFEEVVDQPKEEQLRFLQAACGGDPTLVNDVALLLDADAAGSHKALCQNITCLAEQLFSGHESVTIPRQFGRYSILRELGQGGMGRVYLVERDDLGDKVAVKFLQNAWTLPQQRYRFACEQQMLARLTHPNIAKLYDAGVENETPWFAMEYVNGKPLIEYCADHHLGLAERLKLFHRACEAIRYAHRSLTVHLDLKPSNILVTDEGEVKLLDFGIARSLDAEGRETQKTETGLRLFSLNYASPEQIRGEVLDIQTDIHGLGVILYELVTGKVPADLSQVNANELLRFTEHEVQRPSEAARKNRANSLQISRADWNDLDVICATALHRERCRRYQTADALIRDLDHFLKREPLEAQKDSLRYRLSKFVARNQWQVTTSVGAIALVAILSALFTFRLIAAKNEALASRTRMQQIQQLMLNLFSGGDEAAGPAKGLRAVELLDRGVQQADSLGAQPELQAQLRFTLATLFHKIGRLDRPEPLLRSALLEQQRYLGPDASDTLKTQLELSSLYKDQAKLQDAERLAQDALARTKKVRRNADMEIAAAEAALGSVLSVKGDYKRAIPQLQDASSVLEKGGPSVELSSALSDLANACYESGDVQSAEAIRKRLLDLDRKLFGFRHPAVANDLHDLAMIATDHAQYRKAELLLREALDINLAWYGEAHRQTGETLTGLGMSLVEQHRYDEASIMFDRALASIRASDGERSERYAIALSLQGDLARAQRQLDKAGSLYQRAAEIMREVLGEKHEFYAVQLSSLGAIDVLKGDYAQAEQILRRALAILESAVSAERYTAMTQARLAAALTGEKKFAEAEKLALAAYATVQVKTGPGSSEIKSARKILHDLYTAMDQPSKAEQFQ